MRDCQLLERVVTSSIAGSKTSINVSRMLQVIHGLMKVQLSSHSQLDRKAKVCADSVQSVAFAVLSLYRRKPEAAL